jgi:hypothetical protein
MSRSLIDEPMMDRLMRTMRNAALEEAAEIVNTVCPNYRAPTLREHIVAEIRKRKEPS